MLMPKCLQLINRRKWEHSIRKLEKQISPNHSEETEKSYFFIPHHVSRQLDLYPAISAIGLCGESGVYRTDQDSFGGFSTLTFIQQRASY